LTSAAKDNIQHVCNNKEEILATTIAYNSNVIASPKPPHNEHGLAGLPEISCIFCKSYKTQIEFELSIHLQERHRMELIKKLSMGNGYHSIVRRADYAVDLCKKVN
jgi:hypothetical protein